MSYRGPASQTLMRAGLAAGLLAILHCAAAQTATSTITTGKSTADTLKGTVDSTEKTVLEAKEKAKAEAAKARGEAGGGGGSASGSGEEKKEDDDATRIQARPTPLDRPVNDELSAAKGDRVDWKAYDLSRIRPGTWVMFELNWDEQPTEINLDVYNQVGAQVVQSPGRSGTTTKKIPFRVDTPGIYYAKLHLVGKNDASVYTVTLRAGGNLGKPLYVGSSKGAGSSAGASGGGAAGSGGPGGGGGAAGGGGPGGAGAGAGPGGGMAGGLGGGFPPGGAGYPPAGGGFPPGGAGPASGGASGGAEAGAPPIPAGAIVGRVLQAFRGEDGKLTLYLNKGKSAKVKVGMTGTILQGSEGGQVLEGATFTVTKVVGDGQSVATTDYDRPLGKNTRFMIVKK
ncbi:MAG: hypothetical protein RMK29_16180 [Myxococcales bacterium]|nr:hypothetical protein [Myxococcales bacterium]